MATACSASMASTRNEDAGSDATDGSTGNPDGAAGGGLDGGGGTRDAGEFGSGGSVHLDPRDYARIFFSGHSLLDNPMPDFVEEIAASRGDDVRWNQQNIPGSPIRVRTYGDGSWDGYRAGKNRVGEGMNVVDELRSPSTLGAEERYDTLLLTERNDPLETIRWEDTLGFLHHYHERLIEGNAAARTLLYQVWPAIDKAAPEAWIEHVKKELVLWECAASKLNLYLEGEGRSDRIGVVPGGVALVTLVEWALDGAVPGVEGSTSERLDAIFSDDVHLTPLAIYFIAALHYGAVYGKSPVGSDHPAALSQETATVLQQIAWGVLTRYHESASPWQHSMETCRTRISEVACPSFWTFHGQPDRVSWCSFWANDGEAENPFKWPDPGYTPRPAP